MIGYLDIPVWVLGFSMGDSLGVFLLSMLYCVAAIIYSLLSRKDRLSPILILRVTKGPLRRVCYCFFLHPFKPRFHALGPSVLRVSTICEYVMAYISLILFRPLKNIISLFEFIAF